MADGKPSDYINNPVLKDPSTMVMPLFETRHEKFCIGLQENEGRCVAHDRSCIAKFCQKFQMLVEILEANLSKI